jgi:hypothetical protein
LGRQKSGGDERLLHVPEALCFKVSLLDPALALKRKKAARRQDLQILARGEASRDQLQRANSFFGGRAKRFQIVDYGGLNE